MRTPGFRALQFTALLALAGTFLAGAATRPAGASWWPLFRGPEAYEAGHWPSTATYRGGNSFRVAAGDLNGDGRPDLVVTNNVDSLIPPSTYVAGSTVSVLLLDGSGAAQTRFLPKTNYPTGTNPTGVVLADMDLDGNLDIVTQGYMDSVSVLFGTGTGSFGAPTTYRSGVTDDGTRCAVTVANVNGDAWPDLVVPGRDLAVNRHRIAVLLGTGSGSLGPASLVDVASPPSAGQEIHGIAVSDLTEDGAADILVVGLSDFTAVLLLGNNTGAFTQTSTTVPSGLAVSLAQANGDAQLDAIITDGINVYVSLGSGGGSFQPAVTYPLVDHQPFELDARDVDADGKVDIVTTQINAGFAVLRGGGDGTFAAPAYYPLPHLSGPVRLTDLNGDGHLDVASPMAGLQGDRTHTVNVILADMAGGFRTPKISVPTVGASMNFHTIADFNRDGEPDIAASDPQAGKVRISLGSGDGTFTEIGSISEPGPGVIVASDYNGDGRLDILVPTITGGPGMDLRGLPGNGDGTFVTPGNLLISASLGLLDPSSVVDMNRDGRQDLVVILSSRVHLSIRCRSTTGTYPVTHTITRADTINAFESEDWNRDAIPDLAVATTTALSLYTGTGTGTVNAEVVVASGKSYADVCGGDFNQDGKPDLAGLETIAGQSATRGIDVFLGNGLGGFGAPVSMGTLEQNGIRIVCRDVNRDGHPDLIASGVGDPSPNVAQIEVPASAEVHLGDGSGGFGPGYAYSLGSSFINGYREPFFSATDVNGDDTPDLVAPSKFGGMIQTLLAELPDRGRGIGAKVDYSMLSGTRQAAVGDVNRDGILDVVTSSYTNPGVSVRLGMGDGTFGPKTDVTQSLGAWKADLADMNRDGILDLVTVRTSLGFPEIVSCMLGVGDGTFGPRLDVAFQGVNEFEIADMNRDGIPDIVAGQAQLNTVHVLLGNGDGTFVAAPTGGSIPWVWDLEVVDVDRDGKSDVVAVASDMYVLYGNGDGTLANSVQVTLGSSTLQRLCLADFDRDGFMDVATVDVSSRLFVAWGSASPPFSDYDTFMMPYSALDVQIGTAAADGRPFVYFSALSFNRLVLLEPSWAGGNLSFTVAGMRDTPLDPEGLVLADFNRDGLLDAMTANSGPGDISVFLHSPGSITGVATVPDVRPRARLDQNFPNPFNPATTVRYSVPASGHVRLDIFDVRGRLVTTLVNGLVPAGEYTIRWSGQTQAGQTAASGVYFYRLRTDSGDQESRRMVLLK